MAESRVIGRDELARIFTDPRLRVAFERLSRDVAVLLPAETAGALRAAEDAANIAESAGSAAVSAHALLTVIAEALQVLQQAPAQQQHVQPADDAPGDVAALRTEIATLRARVDALEIK